ncbi:zinc finger MIZ domain-containing protein [Microdochium nivale]|nr:zinc finger MIZ domain-containing protein [Microdochium nivale]
MAPVGVRPPASCDTSSRRRVEQSNSTLKTWLPGRRQPSWLINAKPVTPTPRLPQATKFPRSPSVQLLTTAPARIASVAATTTDVAAAEDEGECLEPAPSAQPHSSSVTTLPVLPSPDTGDETSPEPTGTHRSAQVADMPLSSDHAAAQPRHHVDSAPAAQPGHSLLNAPASLDHESGRSPLSTPIMGHMSTVPPASPSNPPPLSAAPAQRSHQLSEPEMEMGGPAKRRRVASKNMDALRAWGAAENLAELNRWCGGNQPLDPNLEQPRLQLLEDACKTGDIFYIVLHQVFCLWTVNPFEIRGLFQHDTNSFSMAEHGLHAVSNLLRNNASIRQTLLNCLANFPAPFPRMQRDPLYSMTLNAVIKFLFSMASSWTSLIQQHAVNGIPLFMDELLGQLHMHSQVLQVIVFRASRRTTGIADGPIAAQMEVLFKEDQQRHIAQDGTFSQRAHDAEYTRYLESLTTRYKQLVQLFREQLNSGALAHGQQQRQSSQYSHQPGNPVPSHGPIRVGHVSPSLVQSQQWPVLPSQLLPATDGASAFQTQLYPQQLPTISGQIQTIPASSINNHQPIMSQPQVQSLIAAAPMQHGVQPPSLMRPWPSQSQDRQQIGELNYHQQSATSSSGEPVTQFPASFLNAQYQFGGSPTSNQSPVFSATIMNGRSSSGSPVVWPRAFPSPTTTHNLFNAEGRQPSQSQMQQPAPAKHIASGHLFPAPDYRIPINEYPNDPHDNTCILNSLHQAHVRSPKRLPRHLEATRDRHERHYQAVKKLALGPVTVKPAKVIHKFNFSLSVKDKDRLSRTDMWPGRDLLVHKYASGSLRLRIRCCYIASTQSQEIAESDWVTKDMIWPEHVFIEVNRLSLTLRRKAHHSKDLPVEIPADALLEENSVHVWVPETAVRPRDVPKDSQPHIAVELVEMLSHSAILSLVKTHSVQPLSDTLEIIKRRLASTSTGDDDDEVAMVSHELAIDLADPFSSTIFKIPVRGKCCTHLECFDLETWLNTRLGKKKACTCEKESSSCETCPSEPSFVDKWKCPLCSADARPYSLRIDLWLQGVREKLEAQGHLRAKSISVSADGTWKVKDLPDENDDDDDDNSGNENQGTAGAKASSVIHSTTSIKRGSSVSRTCPAAGGSRSASHASAPIIIEIDDD